MWYVPYWLHQIKSKKSRREWIIHFYGPDLIPRAFLGFFNNTTVSAYHQHHAPWMCHAPSKQSQTKERSETKRASTTACITTRCDNKLTNIRIPEEMFWAPQPLDNRLIFKRFLISQVYKKCTQCESILQKSATKRKNQRKIFVWCFIDRYNVPNLNLTTTLPTCRIRHPSKAR